MIFLKSLFSTHLTISVFRVDRNLGLIKAISDLFVIEFEGFQVYYLTLVRAKSHVDMTRERSVFIRSKHSFDKLSQ